MYDQLIKSIIHCFHSSSNGDVDFLSMIFNTTIDDLRTTTRSIYINDFIALLLGYLNNIDNSMITIPLITKLMVMNNDTNTQHYLIRILTESIDAYLLNNNSASAIYNRMEGAANGLIILLNNTDTNDAGIVEAFLTLCHKLNYAIIDNNAMNGIIGLALGLLLQPISMLVKKANADDNKTNAFTNPTFFFFLTLVLKKYEALWEQKGAYLLLSHYYTNTNANNRLYRILL